MADRPRVEDRGERVEARGGLGSGVVEDVAGIRRRAHVSGLNATTASGGRVISSRWCRPCHGRARAFTPPRFPTPLPPYSVASEFRISRQRPPAGTPTRKRERGTGVKLQTASTVCSGSPPRRRKASVLCDAS